MNMLGHEHECGQSIPVAHHGPINALGEHPSPNVAGQQGPPAIAGKRQFAAMTRVAVVPDRLSMPWAVSHMCSFVPLPGTTGQASSATRPLAADPAGERALLVSPGTIPKAALGQTIRRN